MIVEQIPEVPQLAQNSILACGYLLVRACDAAAIDRSSEIADCMSMLPMAN